MKDEKHHSNQSIQVIGRAAEILRFLGKNSSGHSLGGIAKAVSLPRSTVQRIVTALAEEGFVSIGASGGGVRLGPEIQTLAQASFTLPQDRFRPVLSFIAQATGETVDLAVFRGDKMLFIDQVVGSQRLRTVSSIGESFPLTSTANGKAALACFNEFEATRLIMAEMASFAPKGRELTQLLAELEGIRNGELARDNGEHTAGISALGFAVTAANGEVYALSLPVPTSRFESKEQELVKAMKAGLSKYKA
ncbi:IclR family transcriptional regulator [Algirhabdus cladophorae]|uniref:IclR family transcriptional regulator n=1 Tax=Algirhabdus cladophorae TaxID=3377108 RepID=UPI003B848F22